MTIEDKLKEFVSEKRKRLVFIYDNINHLLWKTNVKDALTEADYYSDFRRALLLQEVGRFELSIGQNRTNEIAIWLNNTLVFRNSKTDDYSLADPLADHWRKIDK